ncbi:hypothetical protein B0H15DRAFT_797464 [Mycena belliarum]|uniref:Uncharacterized protein n=1 Tax=Mycena belliarum TaxID=1033014 RepID=A0AAD6XVJ3_9AGAR|nr:hypothetical protein B0H15DRAFT_797464 [Mycena belliae]
MFWFLFEYGGQVWLAQVFVVVREHQGRGTGHLHILPWLPQAHSLSVSTISVQGSAIHPTASPSPLNSVLKMSRPYDARGETEPLANVTSADAHHIESARPTSEDANDAFFLNVFSETRAFIDEYNDVSTTLDVHNGDRVYAGDLGFYPAWNSSDVRAEAASTSVAVLTNPGPVRFERVKRVLRKVAQRLRRFFN